MIIIYKVSTLLSEIVLQVLKYFLVIKFPEYSLSGLCKIQGPPEDPFQHWVCHAFWFLMSGESAQTRLVGPKNTFLIFLKNRSLDFSKTSQASGNIVIKIYIFPFCLKMCSLDFSESSQVFRGSWWCYDYFLHLPKILGLGDWSQNSQFGLKIWDFNSFFCENGFLSFPKIYQGFLRVLILHIWWYYSLPELPDISRSWVQVCSLHTCVHISQFLSITFLLHFNFF